MLKSVFKTWNTTTVCVYQTPAAENSHIRIIKVVKPENGTSLLEGTSRCVCIFLRTTLSIAFIWE